MMVLDLFWVDQCHCAHDRVLVAEFQYHEHVEEKGYTGTKAHPNFDLVKGIPK